MEKTENDAKDYLAALGEPALPDGLWQRVEGARRRRMRSRIGAVAASVAAVALAFALVLPGALDPGPEAPRLADGAAVPQRPAPADAADRVRTVQAIDRALQAAYDRNASDDELEPLWQARRALVQGPSASAASSG